MPENLEDRYIDGRRAGKERRTTSRYPFSATCDATETKSHARILGRTSDLGRGGCYIDTIGPFPVGALLVVRISRESQTLTIEGKVAFAQSGMGMGLAFTSAAPDQQALLDEWIAELSGEHIAKPTVANSKILASAEAGGSAKTDNSSFFVINELILLLLQKGVLTELEGRSLLQKLLK